MELYRMFRESKMELLSPEGKKVLRQRAIELGLPPDYFLSGFQAFYPDTTSMSVTALKEHLKKLQLLRDYNEQIFLAWQDNCQQLHSQIEAKQRRFSRLKKRKSGWLVSNFRRLQWEEQNDFNYALERRRRMAEIGFFSSKNRQCLLSQ